MTTEAALVAAIAAAPDDDAPRLVFADWLAERGDLRGELIHLQVARAAMRAGDERAKPTQARIDEFLEAHRTAWLGKLALLARQGIQFSFDRGMIGVVMARLGVLAKHAAGIVGAAPLVDTVNLVLDRVDRDLALLAPTPLPPRIRALTIAGGQASRVTGWEALALPALRKLFVGTVAFGPDELGAALAAPNLTSLHFDRCRFNKGSVEAFARITGPLHSLGLQAAHLGPRLGEIAGRFHALVEVSLAGNELGGAGLTHLLPALRNINHLDLRGNALTAADLPGLLDAIPRVQSLELGGNALGDAGAAAIAQHPIAAQLTRLHLGEAGITSRGARALAAAPHLAALRSLVLTGKRFDPETEAILVASPHLAGARIYGGDRFLARAPAPRTGPSRSSG